MTAEELAGHRAAGDEGGDYSGRHAGHPSPGAEAEALLKRASDLIASARPVLLSASVMINKEEVLELLDDAIERLPEELRAARWLLKERDEFLASAQTESADIVDAARTRAERMVQRTEVVKAAEVRARKIIEAAEAEARRLRHECEDFCDQKLASFEIVLERTARMVAAGREKLQGTALIARQQAEAAAQEQDEDGNAFFDQDQV
jgi:cell division septum initiation protein DivIVA